MPEFDTSNENFAANLFKQKLEESKNSVPLHRPPVKKPIEVPQQKDNSVEQQSSNEPNEDDDDIDDGATGLINLVKPTPGDSKKVDVNELTEDKLKAMLAEIQNKKKVRERSNRPAPHKKSPPFPMIPFPRKTLMEKLRTLGINSDYNISEDQWNMFMQIITKPIDPPPPVIGVISLKGGVGKTTIVSLVSAIIARARGKYSSVVAVDGDKNGILARRAMDSQPDTVNNFAKRLKEGVQDYGSFMAHTVDGVCILGSQPGYSANDLLVNDWNNIIRALKKTNDIIFVDLPPESSSQYYQSLLEIIDAALVVSSTIDDSLTRVQQIEDMFTARPEVQHLSEAYAIAITHTEREISSESERQVKKILHTFQSTGVEAVEIPFDEHLHQGNCISYDETGVPTKKQGVLLAAAVMQLV